MWVCKLPAAISASTTCNENTAKSLKCVTSCIIRVLFRVPDESTMMDALPNKLRKDLAIHVHFNTLSKVKLFSDCDKTLLYDLVLKLKPILYLPGDYVCKKVRIIQTVFPQSLHCLYIFMQETERPTNKYVFRHKHYLYNDTKSYLLMSVASLYTPCFVMFCVFLYWPFCHGAHKLDLSTLFTTCFLWTSLPFILCLTT